MILWPLIGGIAYWALARRLNVVHLVLITAVPTILGAAALAGGGARPEVLLILASIALICGYHLAGSVGSVRGGTSTGLERSFDDGAPGATTFRFTRSVIYLGTVYYFAVGGVPLFSSNVEVNRFNFSGGGAFGIPGRLYLYGLPIAFALAVVEARRANVRTFSYGPVRLSLAVYVAARLVSGFKSGLLEVLTVVLIAQILSPNPLRPTRAMRRLAVPLTIALVFAYYVGTAYATYKATGNPGQAFVNRVTRGSADGPVAVLTDNVHGLPSGHDVLQSDFRYFTREYFHIGSGAPYSFEKLVSATIAHGSPYSAFNAPVTTGAFVDLYFQFGATAALVFVALLGATLQRVTRMSSSPTVTPRRWMVGFIVVQALFGYLTKGDFVYQVTNWASVGVLVGVLAFGETLARRSLRDPSTSAMGAANARLVPQRH